RSFIPGAIGDRCRLRRSWQSRIHDQSPLTLPLSLRGSPGFLGSWLPDFGIAIPNVGELNSRIGVYRLIAAEVQAEKQRHGLLGGCGKIEEDVHLSDLVLFVKRAGDLFTKCRSAERMFSNVKGLAAHLQLLFGSAAVYVGGKQVENFCTAKLVPGFSLGDALAADQGESIRQGILSAFRLVVIGWNRLRSL